MAKLDYYQDRIEIKIIPSLEKTSTVISNTISVLNAITTPSSLISSTNNLNEKLNRINGKCLSTVTWLKDSVVKLNNHEQNMVDSINLMSIPEMTVLTPKVTPNSKI